LIDNREERIRTVHELSDEFMREYVLRHPKSGSFARYAVSHVSRLLGHKMSVDISDKAVVEYQMNRLKEGAAPKTINEEVGFLLRMLPIAQAGALRALLKQQRKLKLKVMKTVGKAYSDEEKTALVASATRAPKSKAIHLATVLALHAGMRDKEIRTLQWSRFDLEDQMVTVGESKTDAGTGRKIPMNLDLFSAAIEYRKWYTARFGVVQASWYVFPFGKPTPSDPTRPQTSLKTAWRNVRRKANVDGRFHDTRHTFVTDLAESGAADEVIRDMAGHVSKDMLKHYSHIRTQAKRRAVEALSTSKMMAGANPT
jgi:integrase